MRSPRPAREALSGGDRDALVRLARDGVEHAAARGEALVVDPSDYADGLRQRLGCFVTLEQRGALRGCVGVLAPRWSLVEEVAHAAYGAARRDPRFSPVRVEEVGDLTVRISVLSSPRALPFTSEGDLVEQLVPGLHGVILRDGARTATFLPAVWRHFPEADSFLRALRQKAGLAPDHFSPTMEILTYTAQSFGR